MAIRITDTVYDSFKVDFGNGTVLSGGHGALISHQYPTATEQTIKVTGFYTIVRTDQQIMSPCSGKDTTFTITPINDLPKPVIRSLAMTSPGSASLIFESNPFLNYKIYQKTGSSDNYQPIATINNPVSSPSGQEITGLTNTNEVYYFRVEVSDVCAENKEYSEEISTIPLTVTAANDQINISWQRTPPFYNQFVLYKDSQVLTTIANGSQKTFTDTDVRCPDEYCYKIIAQTSGGSQSISALACAKAISQKAPPAVQNFTATIQDGFPSLRWVLPPNIAVQEYVILRSENNGPFKELARTNAVDFKDTKTNTRQTAYCYQVQYTNTCGNTSPLNTEACPMLLTKNQDGEKITLTWTPYRHWDQGVASYFIEKLDENGSVYETIPVSADLTYTLPQEPDLMQQILYLRVKAVSNGNPILESYSNVVEVIQQLRLFLPDAFTPNGDGVNDTFLARGWFVKRFNMVIYNRWGEVLFTTDTLDTGWDGKVSGNRVPAGVYVYAIEAEDFTGRRVNKKGTLLVI